MLTDTLNKIEQKVKESPNIPDHKKSEYFKLLYELNTEINQLQKTESEKAISIKGFTEVAAHEATRQEVNPQLMRISIDGLYSSVNEFEVSYPKLSQAMNSFCNILANIGI